MCNCVTVTCLHIVKKTWLWCCWQVTNNDSLLHLTDTVDRHIDTMSKVNYALFCNVMDIINAR